jgi:hypothetical protein
VLVFSSNAVCRPIGPAVEWESRRVGNMCVGARRGNDYTDTLEPPPGVIEYNATLMTMPRSTSGSRTSMTIVSGWQRTAPRCAVPSLGMVVAETLNGLQANKRVEALWPRWLERGGLHSLPLATDPHQCQLAALE